MVHFAWTWITQVFPVEIIPGLTMCKESLLKGIPLFYVAILRSFAYVNRLNGSANVGQQRNIWGTEAYPRVNLPMIACGFVEVADLPINNGLLDYRRVQYTLQQHGYRENIFLLCVVLQSKFKLALGCLPSERQFPLHLEREVSL